MEKIIIEIESPFSVYMPESRSDSKSNFGLMESPLSMQDVDKEWIKLEKDTKPENLMTDSGICPKCLYYECVCTESTGDNDIPS